MLVGFQLDWLWYLMELSMFVGVMWFVQADKSVLPGWLGPLFRHGIVAWCLIVAVGVFFGWRMFRIRQRRWPAWGYWYRNGVIASFVMAFICEAVMLFAFFKGLGVPVEVEIVYVPSERAVATSYTVHARDWNATGSASGGERLVIHGVTDLSDGLTVRFDQQPFPADSGRCSISVNGRPVSSGGESCRLHGAYYVPFVGLIVSEEDKTAN